MMNANFFNPANFMEQMMDQWVSNCNLFNKMTEQAEKATLAWFEQSRSIREQTLKMATDMAEQAKANARTAQEMFDANLRMTTEATTTAAREGMSGFSRIQQLAAAASQN